MRIKTVYELTCECGKTHYVEQDHISFVCGCGRKSVIDFAANLTEEQVRQLLDGVMVKADKLAKVLEMTRRTA